MKDHQLYNLTNQFIMSSLNQSYHHQFYNFINLLCQFIMSILVNQQHELYTGNVQHLEDNAFHPWSVTLDNG